MKDWRDVERYVDEVVLPRARRNAEEGLDLSAGSDPDAFLAYFGLPQRAHPVPETNGRTRSQTHTQ